MSNKLAILLCVLFITAGTYMRNYRGTIEFAELDYPVKEVTDSGWTATSTQMFIEVAQGWDPKDWGGVEWNNRKTGLPESLRRFHVTYAGALALGVQWTEVIFQKDVIGSDSTWYASLDSSNVRGATLGGRTLQLDISTLSADSMIVRPLRDAPRIWGGKPNVFIFTTDDGIDSSNVAYGAVFDTFGVGFTAFIEADLIGDGAGHLDTTEVYSLYDLGVEIACHGTDPDEWTTWEDSTYSAGEHFLALHLPDSKRQIEEFMWVHDSDYICRGVAYPTNLTDGKVLDVVRSHFEYGRGGQRDSAIPIGQHNGDTTHPTWHTLRPFEIARLYGASAWFNSGAYDSAQVDSAVSANLTTAQNLSDYSYLGGTITRKNVMVVMMAHNHSEATPAQVEAMLNAVEANGSYAIMTMWEAIRMWQEAHPERKRAG